MNFHKHFCQVPVPYSLRNVLHNENRDPLSYIDCISKINILVGSNNSGKSRIIRELLKPPLAGSYFPKDIRKVISDIFDKSLSSIESFLKTTFPLEQNFLLRARDTSELQRYEILELFQDPKSIGLDLEKILEERRRRFEKVLVREYNVVIYGTKGTQQFHGSKNMLDTIRAIFDQMTQELEKYYSNKSYSRIYIPSYRSLKKFMRTANMIDSTQKEYGINPNKADVDEKLYNTGVVIENGQKFYESVLHNYTSTSINKKKNEQFCEFLSEYFFEGAKVDITANQLLQEIQLVIGREAEQLIYNLGDGLQMIMILTFPLFNFDSGFIMIEEPELYIHPGMQKKLIDIYLNHPKAKDFIFFIATHSNHVIDSINSSDKISIFTVKKFLKDPASENILPGFIIENVGHGTHSALNLLGVSNTSVYLANCTIWVEGVTDKLYLAKFIQAFLSNPALNSKYRIKKFQEGINYSFVYSGGDNIIHLDFTDDGIINELSKDIVVRNLCGRALIVVDSDLDKNPKRKRDMSGKLGARFEELPVIEIENLLSREVIVNAIRRYPSCSQIDISKLPDLTKSQLKSIRIGTLIDKYLLAGVNLPGKKKFEAIPKKTNSKTIGKTYTINDKLGFCQKSLEFIHYNNLTTETNKLVEKILDFILEHNR